MFEDKPQKKQMADPTPPLAEEVLIKIFKRWRLKHNSDHIPRDNLEAAKWWMAHQEEHQQGDLPYANTNKDGNITGWTTPYHDRLSYNLQKFLKLSEPEKAFVIHHVENDVPYRGDDIEFYKQVVTESDKMKLDRDKYIEDGFKKMHTVLRGMHG